MLLTGATEHGVWMDVHLSDALETPDEHYDVVHMLTDADWDALLAVYPSRTPRWREALAYVVAQGPSGPSLRVLRIAIRDEDRDVAVQAALSMIDLCDLDVDVKLADEDRDAIRAAARDATDAVRDDLLSFLDG
ncbi:MAG: hypothetical protein IT379_06245 [Deltaproteobacteria bacterium]|nr:hypothetical protein [Deltaproteobacteria bacterium]